MVVPYARLYYHIVWTTKYRAPVIEEVQRFGLYEAIAEKAIELGGLVYALNGTKDHVHLLVTVPAKRSLSSFISQIKGYSSRYMSQRPDHPTDAFTWQSEYGAFSVSPSVLPHIMRYIEDQQQHHAT